MSIKLHDLLSEYLQLQGSIDNFLSLTSEEQRDRINQLAELKAKLQTAAEELAQSDALSKKRDAVMVYYLIGEARTTTIKVSIWEGVSDQNLSSGQSSSSGATSVYALFQQVLYDMFSKDSNASLGQVMNAIERLLDQLQPEKLAGEQMVLDQQLMRHHVLYLKAILLKKNQQIDSALVAFQHAKDAGSVFAVYGHAVTVQTVDEIGFNQSGGMISWLDAAVNCADMIALYEYANAQLQTRIDRANVLPLWEASALLGYPLAMNAVAKILTSNGPERDLDRGFKWYLKAAQLGSQPALTALRKDVFTDYLDAIDPIAVTEAIRLFRALIDKERAQEQSHLTQLLQGKSPASRCLDAFDTAEACYHRAVVQRDVAALTALIDGTVDGVTVADISEEFLATDLAKLASDSDDLAKLASDSDDLAKLASDSELQMFFSDPALRRPLSQCSMEVQEQLLRVGLTVEIDFAKHDIETINKTQLTKIIDILFDRYFLLSPYDEQATEQAGLILEKLAEIFEKRAMHVDECRQSMLVFAVLKKLFGDNHDVTMSAVSIDFEQVHSKYCTVKNLAPQSDVYETEIEAWCVELKQKGVLSVKYLQSELEQELKKRGKSELELELKKKRKEVKQAGEIYNDDQLKKLRAQFENEQSAVSRCSGSGALRKAYFDRLNQLLEGQSVDVHLEVECRLQFCPINRNDNWRPEPARVNRVKPLVSWVSRVLS